MGTIEKNFLNDGFKVTYSDGVVERFHKNLLDDNYRGDKGSSIVSHWIDDGFTVNKYDGTKENFQWRGSKEILAGDKGTRIRESFWGDCFVSENPYAGYNPPKISDVRKAKYQETPIRAYVIDKNNSTTLEELKNDLQDIIDSAGLQIHLSDVVVDGNPAVAIVSNTNSAYMPVCCYFASEKNEYFITCTVRGKGYQTNATDLSKMYYKAASPWGKLQIRASQGGAMANYFGYSVRAGGAIGGISALAGMAIGGGIRLAAKGIKVLLRDNDAYKLEMDFYNQAAGVVDYAIGYNDSYGIIELIRKNAEMGLPIAQYQMGTAHVYGIGVEANENDAFAWFERAAEAGELRSQNIVAGEYLYNKEKTYTIEQKKQGVYYLYNLASFGEEWAGELIIDIYGRNSVDGIETDIDEAVRVSEILAEGDNLHALNYLASVYDRRVTQGNPLGYEDDKKAFLCYDRIMRLDSARTEELSMKLASMCKEGIGTEISYDKAVNYYDIAASKGNPEAKLKLVEAYTFGIGVERSAEKAKLLAKELLRSKNEHFISEAKYYLSINADKEELYGKALKYAREYIESPQTDQDKANYLRKYIADMEERISGMSDEERRAFLKERPKLSLDIKNLRWFIIGFAVVIAIIIAIVIAGRSSSSDEYAFDSQEDDSQLVYDQEAYSAGVPVNASASSELENQGDNTYYAENAIDGDETTAWVEGVAGDGVDESIIVSFDNKDPITALRISNGYQKSEETFQQNNRVENMEAKFEDGSVELFTLLDHEYGDQIIFLSSPKEGHTVELTIKSTYPGSDYDDTCISEIGIARGDMAYPSSITMIYAEPMSEMDEDEYYNEDVSDGSYYVGTWVARGTAKGNADYYAWTFEPDGSAYFITGNITVDGYSWWITDQGVSVENEVYQFDFIEEDDGSLYALVTGYEYWLEKTE